MLLDNANNGLHRSYRTSGEIFLRARIGDIVITSRCASYVFANQVLRVETYSTKVRFSQGTDYRARPYSAPQQRI